MKKRNLPIVLMVLALIMTSCGGPTGQIVQEPADDIDDNPKTLKILVLNFDPILEARGDIRLHEIEAWWNDPRDISEGFIQDFDNFTDGYIQKEIVEWVDLDEWPRRNDGYRFTDDFFLSHFDDKDYPAVSFYNENEVLDYDYYIDQYDIVNRVNSGEIDQVWMFGYHYMGSAFYESRMVGKDAYWCNSPGIQMNCAPFIVYYFNYERGVDCMLENTGHAMESILTHIFGSWDHTKPLDQMNKWERFTLYANVAPGNAACGNVHYAPNSTTDYDWGNESMVWSTYVDWENYPTLSGEKKRSNAADWGNGDMRLHHIWWFNLFPKIPGKDAEGFFHNWWKYYVAPTIND